MVWMGVCWAPCLLGNPHVVFSSGVFAFEGLHVETCGASRLVEELVVSSVAGFRGFKGVAVGSQIPNICKARAVADGHLLFCCMTDGFQALPWLQFSPNTGKEHQNN